MEGTRQAPARRPARLCGPADDPVLRGDLLDHREQHCAAGAAPGRARGPAQPERTDIYADAGLMGLVRLILGRLIWRLRRRLLRRGRLVRGRRRFGELVNRMISDPDKERIAAAI